MYCKDCKNCKLVWEESMCSVKCMKTSKKGKTIYWALNLVAPERISADIRCEEFLEKSKKGKPRYCLGKEQV